MAQRKGTTLERLEELERLVAERPGLHIRYSEGLDADGAGSVDSESGLTLPGLSVNPLDPEAWWTRPARDWLARQLCQYKHLAEDEQDRFAWVAAGTVVARGPDGEPLLAHVEEVARLSKTLLDEAERVYEDRFEARKGPTD